MYLPDVHSVPAHDDQGMLKNERPNCGEDRRDPRLLLIVKTPMNAIDSVGGTLRNWFGDVPAGWLSQIYSDDRYAEHEIHYSSYHLGGEDRVLGRLFVRLKKVAQRTTMVFPPSCDGSDAPRNRLANFLRRLVAVLSQWLANRGYWELLFPFRASRRLAKWLDDQHLSLIYAQGGDLTFLRVALYAQMHCHVPLWFHFADDWPATLYRQGPPYFIVRPLVQHYLRRILKSSTRLICISDSMAESYGVRYHRVFEVLSPCCDAKAYVGLSPTRAVSPSVLSLVYSGSLYLGRPRVLAIVVSALELLRERGVVAQLDIYTDHVPDGARLLLERTDMVNLHGAAEDKVAESLLRGADVLLMVEGFERRNMEMKQLSLSSKIPFYLLANRPILVVGPATSGTVRDAQSKSWGTVVTELSAEAIAVAIVSATTPANSSGLAEQQHRRMDALEYYSTGRMRSQLAQWLSVDAALPSRTDSV